MSFQRKLESRGGEREHKIPLNPPLEKGETGEGKRNLSSPFDKGRVRGILSEEIAFYFPSPKRKIKVGAFK
jgi:hypothetical protein